jgi:hypothetical protein
VLGSISAEKNERIDIGNHEIIGENHCINIVSPSETIDGQGIIIQLGGVLKNRSIGKQKAWRSAKQVAYLIKINY